MVSVESRTAGEVVKSSFGKQRKVLSLSRGSSYDSINA